MPNTYRIDLRRTGGLRQLAASLPAWAYLLAVLAFSLAELTGRYQPYNSHALLFSMLPLACLMVCQRSWRPSGMTALWLTCAIGGLAYLGVLHLVQPGVPRLAWAGWMELAIAIALAMALLAANSEPARMLSVLGGASASALSICAVVFWIRGDRGWYGTGNINYLVNGAGPAVIGWSTLLIHRRLRGKVDPIADRLLCAAGAISLVVLAVVLSRRGVQLALIIAVLLHLAFLVARRAPRLCWSIGIGGFVVACIWLWWQVSSNQTAPSANHVRLALYQSAWGVASEAQPWGLGSFGITRSHEVDHPWTRLYGAGGAWNFHAHNQFLNALIDGGIPLLTLLVAQCVIVIVQLRRIGDRPLQLALSCMAAATLLHMMSSVVYGTTIGVVTWYLMVAIIVAAPGRDSDRGFRLPPVRWMLWPLAITCAIAGALFSRSAFMHRQASIGVQWQTLLHVASPMGLIHVIKPMEQQLLYRGGLEYGQIRISGEDMTAALHKVYGEAGPFLRLRFMDTTMRFAEALKEPRADAEQLAAIRQEMAAIGNHYCHVYPFDRTAHAKVAQACQADSEIVPLFDPRLIERIAYFSGNPRLPAPDLTWRPDEPDGLADLHAHILWAIVNGKPWAEISPALEHLVTRAGHVHAVTALAVRAAAHAGLDPHFGWTLERTEVMRRVNYGAPMMETLQDIQSPWRARGVMPLIEKLYPFTFTALHAGRPALDRANRRQEWDAEREALRIYALSRLEVDPSEAPRSQDPDPRGSGADPEPAPHPP